MPGPGDWQGQTQLPGRKVTSTPVLAPPANPLVVSPGAASVEVRPQQRPKFALRGPKLSLLTPSGAWGAHIPGRATCEPAAQQLDARNPDPGTTTTAATTAGWPQPAALTRISWEDAHTAGPRARPAAAVRRPLRPSASPLRGPGSGSLWPPLSPAGAGLGRILNRCEPGAPSLALPGPRRPLPLGCARGAGPQRAQLPSSLLHASWAQRRRWQPSLRRFLRSVDGGQDLQASKGREEKSYSPSHLCPFLSLYTRSSYIPREAMLRLLLA
ncbi:uncharacterized protein LOC144578691 [Callithrix jacchus]